MLAMAVRVMAVSKAALLVVVLAFIRVIDQDEPQLPRLGELSPANIRSVCSALTGEGLTPGQAAKIFY